MVRKLKKLAGEATDNQLAATVRESAQQIWLAGLGAFAKAQEGGVKFFETLVREGETVQAKTRQIAEEKVVDMTSRATGTWDKLEKVFEDRVARSLHSLGVPTKQDIQNLTKRVQELTEVVQRLTEAEATGEAKPAARRRPAKKAA